MKEFVISDTHFGHNGILKYRTQFATSEEHDKYIVDNWNRTVKPEDKVYVLGDVCWKKKDLETLSKLNGKKILIAGNHDILGAKEYLKYFKDVRGLHRKGDVWLSHSPIHENELRGCVNIHGHLHSKTIKQKIGEKIKYVNVCCEMIDYTPMNLTELINSIESLNKDIEEGGGILRGMECSKTIH